jgi:tRNA pseudouridine55 synthase
LDGILVIDKPRGVTSRRVVTEVGRHIGAEKAGHAGTLDPLATGVLVVCIGRGTLLSRYLAGQDKTYRVDALLGVETDTYDIDGQLMSAESAQGLNLAMIEEALEGFSGSIIQEPPPYSAVKHRGKPLYYYARRGIKVGPKPRRVVVESIEVSSFQKGPDGVRLGLELSCGSGTYIRSIIHELGQNLGCGACVSALRRVISGQFSVDSAVPLETLLSLDGRGLMENLVSLEDATGKMPWVYVVSEGERGAALGEPLKRKWIRASGENPDADETFRILNGKGDLIALYGPPRPEDSPEILGRAVRVIRPLSSVSGKDEAA